jgi:hypothetical protein
MKKTRQMLTTILSFIIILTLTGSAFAEDSCVITWEGDDHDTGWAITSETSRTQQATYEAFSLIYNRGIPHWNGSCYHWRIEAWGNCENGSIDDFAICLSGTWSYSDETCWDPELSCNNSPPNCETITDDFGTWDVLCGPDSDNDSIPDMKDHCPNDENNDADRDFVCGDIDNCPNVANTNQEDTDMDSIADACDDDTIYGYVSGDVREGTTVNIYTLSCGATQPSSTVTTGEGGYYAIGNLENGRYLVGPDDAGYSFGPGGIWVDIPQAGGNQPRKFKATDMINSIKGRVSGSDSDLEGVLIRIYRVECGADTEVAVLDPDSDGYFFSDHLPDGMYILATEKPGYNFPSSQILINGDDVVVNILLWFWLMPE